ncbi:hypothetical protein [Amphiplicatus metriothermophilus]|uniref:Peptidase MA superfamily protein n=1 Tax=Amphiplicatus metriothermophilus TaxID=1519374 RepID=A0A239PTY5_9PROT|nr:hypothetical protein [Amphiplicatus metriothermophilus]MBB5519426.1 hypothetical protein [Amphiplicatus metriothermophilus]SNT73598.1 hypothetical protein SAMN06297382_1896 [Amphiplicatus metriothermophilus]
MLRRRRLTLFALAAALAGAAILARLAGEPGGGDAPAAFSVDLAPAPDGAWRATYRPDRPVRRIDLGPRHNGFRSRDWTVETPGAALVEEDGRDVIVAEDGRRLPAAIAVRAVARVNGFAKQYEPITPMGARGAVLYTGHFQPFAAAGRRAPVRFAIRPAPGGRVSAFGETAAAFADWASPHDHPAFVYVGPDAPRAFAGGRLYVDPSAPGWIAAEIETALPRLLGFYARAFGSGGAGDPGNGLEKGVDVFLVMGGAAPGRLDLRGDALPGQILVALSGAGWRAPGEGAREILRRALAHEAAHLWQAAARPSPAGAPDWLHEGAAEALGVEALAGAGFWTLAQADEARVRARYACAAGLDGGSLRAAAAAGRWPAVYACGHALVAAAAAAHNEAGAVAAFWRDFAAEAAEKGGYDLSLFLAMVERRAGPDAARAFALFPGARHAAPERELARLAALAGAGRASLEPARGR